MPRRTGVVKWLHCAADACKSPHEWRKLPHLDPGLPPELSPDDWEGKAAVALFGDLRIMLEPAARRHVVRVIDRQGWGPGRPHRADPGHVRQPTARWAWRTSGSSASASAVPDQTIWPFSRIAARSTRSSSSMTWPSITSIPCPASRRCTRPCQIS